MADAACMGARHRENKSCRRLLRIEPLESRCLLAVFMVDNLNDMPVAMAGDAPGTLRQAIFDANNLAGDDVIVFDPGLTSDGPVTLNLSSAGQLTISGNLAIVGPGASLLTIHAFDPTPGDDNGDGSRVIEIAGPAGPTVTISGMTLTGGDVEGYGGAIYNGGNLTLVECVVTGNQAGGLLQFNGFEYSSFAYGGGVFSSGALTIAHTTISHNSADATNHPGVEYGWRAGGGGIAAKGPLSIVESVIEQNSAAAHFVYGGGLWSEGLTTITNSTVAGNQVLGQYFNSVARGGGVAAVSQVELTIAGSSIHENTASGGHSAFGGGIWSVAPSKITGTTISDNMAHAAYDGTDFAHGGGAAFYGTVEMADSTISGNISHGDYSYGGGIAATGYLSLIRSMISGNRAEGGDADGLGDVSGGGIQARYALVADSTITMNEARLVEQGSIARGGGIGPGQSLTITGSTISLNSADHFGGGIFTRRSVSISKSTLSGNMAGVHGGGIYGRAINYGPGTGASFITLESSTVSGNSAGGNGGGILFEIDESSGDGMLTVTNSTISGNSAGGDGGGIQVDVNEVSLYQSRVAHSTITDNTAATGGGGMRVISFMASLLVDHAIVAGNHDSLGGRNDINGRVAARYSLIGDDSFATITNDGGNLVGTFALPIDPTLGALDENGGPTKTHTLLPDSPAIDAGDENFDPADPDGNPLTDDALPHDQRGKPFARVYDADGTGVAIVDIGAFELQPIPVPPDLPGDYNLDGTVNAADYTVWRDTLGQMGVEPYSGADGNGDGCIDAEDYRMWKLHYGEKMPMSGGGGLAAAAVTESESTSNAPTIVSAERQFSPGGPPPLDAATVTAADPSHVVAGSLNSRRTAALLTPTAIGPNSMPATAIPIPGAIERNGAEVTREDPLLVWLTTSGHQSTDTVSSPPAFDAVETGGSEDDAAPFDGVDAVFELLGAS